MATLFYANQFITTTLAVVGGIDASQTTGIVFQSVTGIDTTKPTVFALNYSDPVNESIIEWCTCTSINSTTKEAQGVVRGAEKGSAKTHSNGVTVAFPLSEVHINNLAAALSIGGDATNGVTGTIDDDTFATASATTIPTSESVRAYVGTGGWIDYSAVVPTRASADDPTYTLTFAGVDLTSTIYPGMRIKWTQNSTVRYAVVTKMAFSTDTTMTVYGGTDYDVEDTGTHTISGFSYSTHKAPAGFPLNPAKWAVTVTNSSNVSQSSPTQNTWYNLGTTASQISIPIGDWEVSYKVLADAYNSASKTQVSIETTLSTANNSASNSDFTVRSSSHTGATTDRDNQNTHFISAFVSLASKTTYYLNARQTETAQTIIQFTNATIPMVIKAVSVYL